MRSGRRVTRHGAPYVWVRVFDRRIAPSILPSISFPGMAPGWVHSSHTSVGAEQYTCGLPLRSSVQTM